MSAAYSRASSEDWGGLPMKWTVVIPPDAADSLDAQRRAAEHLGLEGHAARLADELAAADASAPARIASEFTPTQMMPIVASAGRFEPATGHEAHTGEPLAEPTAVDTAGED
ncbi:hypothetical protein [Agromyces humi]|uniref:hypothetical protein n=1 Tax=Agromyces humi TaxID=1766800 RepID=UPI00135A9A8C|nr:hypothetical protein [Agromyces humi]